MLDAERYLHESWGWQVVSDVEEHAHRGVVVADKGPISRVIMALAFHPADDILRGEN